MEAGRNLLSLPPTFSQKTQLINFPSSISSSVLMLHEHVAPALTSLPHAHLARHVPAPAINLEQQFENRLQLHPVKEEKTSLATPERRLVEAASSAMEGKDTDSEQNKHAAQVQLHHWLSPSYFFLSTGLTDDKLKEQKIVRSTRLLERHSRKRRGPKLNHQVQENKRTVRFRKRINEPLSDPLRMLLWGPETVQLLTKKEESKLIANIQSVMKLQEVERRFQTKFARKPTLSEWAEAAGLTSRELKSQLHSANTSSVKLVSAHLRMVLPIAKQFRGCGLSLDDLFQAGSIGVMKSVEKFKPQAGCRFSTSTYPYWWIRESIRKAIFQNSRLIRLPVKVYTLLYKIRKARESCFPQGNHYPTKEEIAHSVGITVEKLQFLLSVARPPISFTKSLQETTADPTIEAPDVSVEKEMMRRSVHSLLSVLSPRERKIIVLRFGIGGHTPNSLPEIGVVFGLTKERIRQLEKRALDKLRENLSSYGLDGYSNMVFWM